MFLAMTGIVRMPAACSARALVRLLLAVAVAAVAVGWACGQAEASERYRVRAGDTLTAIAIAHHMTVAKLARLNKLDPQQVLLIGSPLRISQPASGEHLAPYVVRPGDTLSGIASGRGIRVADIARINRLDPQALLLEGRRLLLPEGPGKQEIRASIRRWADHYRIPRALALALAWQESGHQAQVVSSAGAVGTMQVVPGTWRYVETVLLGRSVPHTPDGNVLVGLTYLRHLLNTFGNTQRALAAYLQGEYSVRTQGIYRSTRPYVASILAIASRMRGQPA
jgi:LysM repeat protein